MGSGARGVLGNSIESLFAKLRQLYIVLFRRQRPKFNWRSALRIQCLYFSKIFFTYRQLKFHAISAVDSVRVTATLRLITPGFSVALARSGELTLVLSTHPHRHEVNSRRDWRALANYTFQEQFAASFSMSQNLSIVRLQVPIEHLSIPLFQLSLQHSSIETFLRAIRNGRSRPPTN